MFFLFEQIVEEAGGVVTRMDGGRFSVFDRSVLVSNGIVHDKVNLRQLFSSEILRQKSGYPWHFIYFRLYLFLHINECSFLRESVLQQKNWRRKGLIFLSGLSLRTTSPIYKAWMENFIFVALSITLHHPCLWYGIFGKNNVYSYSWKSIVRGFTGVFLFPLLTLWNAHNLLIYKTVVYY